MTTGIAGACRVTGSDTSAASVPLAVSSVGRARRLVSRSASVKGEHPGQAVPDLLADPLADQHVRPDPAVQQQLGERVLDDEVERLGQFRPVGLGTGSGVEERPQVQPAMLGGDLDELSTAVA